MTTSQQTAETVRRVAEAFLAAFRTEDREALAELSDADIRLSVPGAPNVPFAGDWPGVDGVLEFARCLRECATPKRFEVDKILADHEEALVLGRFDVAVNGSDKSYFSEFAVRVQVLDGSVSRYLVLEDSYAIGKAFA